MTKDEAVRAIRAEIHCGPYEMRQFWRGVLVGFTCGENLNFALMKDLAESYANPLHQREVGP